MFPLKDNLRCLAFAWVTVSLIVLNCGAYLWEMVQLGAGNSAALAKFLMVPGLVMAAIHGGDPTALKDAIVSVFGAMFMHGGLMHLIGNMVFLFTFGKAVENRLGKGWFLGFYLLSGIAAAAAQIGSNPASMTPMLGASGAIAGVLGAYLLLWPKADITGYIFPVFVVRIRAYWFLIAWFVMQLLPIFASSSSTSSGGGVAYWAHVGGFLAGIIMAGIARVIRPESDVCYVPSDCPPCDANGGSK